MKDFRQTPSEEFNTPDQNQELTLLKALVQFSLQSKDIDLKELLKPGRKKKADKGLPHRENVDPNGHERQRSSSTEGKRERIPLTKYWRRSSLIRRNQKKDAFLSHESLLEHGLSLRQQLAITTLNLTAPVCSTVLKNQRNNWVQLSGHPGSLVPAGPGTIWKKQPGGTNEAWIYEALMKDSAKGIVPKFYREITSEGEKYIEISDLLHGFDNPSIMDIKIGNRTFLESEVCNTEARSDLYKKMIKLDPNAPTEEEHKAEAVTKLRYMEVREMMSSSRCLSFRIEALKMSDNSPVTEQKKIHTREEVMDVLSSFIERRESAAEQILSRLKTIKEKFEHSKFFKKHEVVGSSILIIYDDTHIGAWIIDFAKTFRLPEDLTITHRKEWCLGNHEEGYLTGLDNLVKCFEEVSTWKSKRKSQHICDPS